jgi:predicted metal-dependent peptidase
MGELPVRIARARMQLMLREPYLAAAVARLPVVDATELPWCRTMATDGYHIYIDTKFCDDLTEDEIAFVLAHELLHCVLGHIDRRGSRERQRWNYAIDYATNALLVAAGMRMPADSLYSRDYQGMTAEEIYERLPPDIAREGGYADRAFSERGGKTLPRGGRIDLHIDPQDHEGAAARAADFPSTEERRRIRRLLASGIRGHLPGREAGLFAEEIRAATTPKVHWQHLLARFVSGLRRTDYRLYPFHRKHLWRGLYLPSTGVPGPEHLVVAVDTSGSMSAAVLSQILGELDRLRAVTECLLSLLECDTVIQRVTVNDPYQDSRPSSGRQALRGGGGTDLRPPFEWVRKRLHSGVHPAPEALIYMTDGFGPMPERAPGIPVLWVVPRHGVPKVPFGTLLRLEV